LHTEETELGADVHHLHIIRNNIFFQALQHGSRATRLHVEKEFVRKAHHVEIAD
jgi:hypothetical protein